MTDEDVSFTGLGAHYFHGTVRHSEGEYVKHSTIHNNTLEGVWSLLKRQIYGIHHWVSVKHLHRYVSEATFRYNRREAKEAKRMAEFLGRVTGRLTYNVLIGKGAV